MKDFHLTSKQIRIDMKSFHTWGHAQIQADACTVVAKMLDPLSILHCVVPQAPSNEFNFAK